MFSQVDYWGLIAGVALFLFAMEQIESGLKTVGGRSLAQFLKRQSGRGANAVFGGIIATALLQSSSVVGLLVLAFTGAGLLSLTAALGIVFGANLGTTLTGWIVATLGFKFEIYKLSLPLIGISGLGFVFFQERWKQYFRALLGLGLLLLGLQLMKSSVAAIEQLIDVNDLAALAPWQYLLFGTLVAAIIQSSSATIMLTLAALHAGVIDLPNAAAAAIGADLGTTTTLIIGALNGSATRKQVAAGQVLFNVVTDLIAFTLRVPILMFVAWLGIADPLYSLVAFHSLFNLLGLCLFIPFTAPFARLLQHLFPEPQHRHAGYLHEIQANAAEAAVDAAERETSLLIAHALQLQMRAFKPPLKPPAGTVPVPFQRDIDELSDLPFSQLYHSAKALEGELLEFVVRLQADRLQSAESERLTLLLRAAREAMHSAKAVKDIRHNLTELAESGSTAEQQFSQRFRDLMQQQLRELYAIRTQDTGTIAFEDLAAALQRVQQRHDTVQEAIYNDVREDRIDESTVSSLLNVNRELLTAGRSLVLALGSYYLDSTRQNDLEQLPT